MNFIALDVETAVGKRWSICQIGLAIVENGEITKTISRLVQPPGNEYSFWNTQIHGITPRMTARTPFFPQVWKEIWPFLEGKCLVAHNAAFDINCLQQTLGYYNIPIPDFKCDCTYKRTGHKLDAICDAYEIELRRHHDACSDAVACARVYLNLLNGIEPDLSKLQLRPAKSAGSFVSEGHEQLCGNVLKPDLGNADNASPFYAKKVVFTGVLIAVSRKEAAGIVKNMGGDIDTSISGRTHFVITGTSPGPSKMAKIQELINQGCNIRIIYEEEFLMMSKFS